MIINSNKLTQTRSNWILNKPLGVVVQDSYNNLSFPIPTIQIDNNKTNVGVIFDQFYSLYNSMSKDQNILPWHYIIEFFDENYIIHNTRPVNLTYPKTMLETRQDIEENKSPVINESTKKLLESNAPIEDMVHILIIGDSSKDIYTKKIYKTIAEYVITPIARYGLLAPVLYNNVLFMNLGDSFKPEFLRLHLNV